MRVGRRAARYRLRQALWRYSSLERVRHCGRDPLSSAVAVVRAEGQAAPVAHFAGLETCGSVWSCPCCQGKILARRAEDASAAAAAWTDAGNTVYMLTVTMAHDDGMPLRALLPTVAGGWRFVQNGRAWRSLRAAFGVAHLIRSVEVTHGPNGWHPHLHVLLFLRGHQDANAMAALLVHVRARWGDYLVRAGYRRPHAVHGVTIAECHSAAEAGAYVAKTDDHRAAGNELARGDLKQGKAGHRTPLEVLAGFRDTGDLADLGLWREYERATKGHQRLTWSRGARAELLPDVADATDQEIAAEEVGGQVLGVIAAPVWRRRVVPVEGLPARVLEAAEAGPAELCRVLAAAGVTLEERGPPP